MDVIPEDLKRIRIGKPDGQRMIAKGEEEEEPLSPMARVFHEPGCNIYIITKIGLKTQILDIQAFKANLGLTLAKHPRFSSLQVASKERGGEIIWVQTEVDMDNHLIVPHIDYPDEKFVEDYICNLSKSTIDKSKPMWDFHILNVKTSDAEAIGVLRVHHSLGDGASLMSLFLACTRKTSDPEALPSSTTVTKKSNLSKAWGFGFVVMTMMMVWNTIVGLMMFVLTALFFKDTKTPLKGSPGVENNPRRIIHRTVSLDDVKFVKRAMNITVNDVVLGVTQAGITKYLNRRYGDGKQNQGATVKKNNLPENIRLRAIFYMNLRPSAGIYDLVNMMEKGTKARWGNEIGYVLLPLTIAFREDPLEYVREASAIMSQKKTSLEVIYSRWIVDLVLKCFGVKAAGKLSHKVFYNTTLWFSNVPGPQEEVAFFGHPVSYIAPTCFGQPNALMIHVVSYVDKLTFILSADEETIPDPHQLGDDLEDSLKLIMAAVHSKTNPQSVDTRG
ncbi:unnamed protein product [Ilex paraguariensis]|uniref:Diacylglycerol O-acyltransferase n=1 Tax=Ilex paraguariensis TaxID=185542 RepID=A0ABC8TGZ7_9AQUA